MREILINHDGSEEVIYDSDKDLDDTTEKKIKLHFDEGILGIRNFIEKAGVDASQSLVPIQDSVPEVKNGNRTINGYTVLKTIASTNFSRTFLVEKYGRQFVIKAVDKVNIRSLELLKREFDKLQKCSLETDLMPAVVEYIEFAGDFANYFGIVEEKIDGLTLEEYVTQERCLTAQEAYRYYLNTTLKLNELHRLGIFHLDLKPDNIVILPDGSIKFIDFGSSVINKGVNSMTLTSMAGTLGYAKPKFFGRENQKMSLEELREYDLYSIAAIGYFMLTGENPEGIKDNSLDLSLKWIKNKENKQLIKLLIRLSAPKLKKDWSYKKLTEKKLDEHRVVVEVDKNKAIARPGGFLKSAGRALKRFYDWQPIKFFY